MAKHLNDNPHFECSQINKKFWKLLQNNVIDSLSHQLLGHNSKLIKFKTKGVFNKTLRRECHLYSGWLFGQEQKSFVQKS